MKSVKVKKNNEVKLVLLPVSIDYINKRQICEEKLINGS